MPRKKKRERELLDFNPSLRRYVEWIRAYAVLLEEQRALLDGLALGTNYLEWLDYIRAFLNEWMPGINACQDGALSFSDLLDGLRFDCDEMPEYLNHTPAATKANALAKGRQQISAEEIDELLARLFAPVREKGFELIDKLLGCA